MKWSQQTLGELTFKIGSGVTPRGGSSVYTNNGVSLIRSQNVYNIKFTTSGLAYISDEIADKMKNVTVRSNDVLLNITGDSVARCCIVPEKALPARINQHVAIIRSDENQLNPLYLMYYLVSPHMQSLMLSFAGSGGTRKALTKTMIEGFDIPVPPLDTQNKITSILSAYDDLIGKNNHRISLLEESARLLFREWFVMLRFPGHENTMITDGVPDGWEMRPLGEICFQHKQSVKPSDIAPGTPYIGLAHIPRRSITLSDWDFADEINSNKFEFETGDILFGKIRPYFHKVGFTLCNGVTSSDAIVIRPCDEQSYSYLLMHVSSDMFVSLASKTVKEGSKMPRADWNYLTKQPLLVPPAAINHDFNGFIKPVLKQLETLALQNQKLKTARDLLLPKLMNGEIPV